MLKNQDYLTIDLTQGYKTIILPEDKWVLRWKWYAARNGDGLVYAAARKKVNEPGPRLIRLHRVIMKAGPGDVVDHIDRDTMNNTRSNLRFVDAQTNSRNRSVFKNNLLGIQGVNLQPSGYRARIYRDGKSMHLGYFKTKEEASAAYENAKGNV